MWTKLGCGIFVMMLFAGCSITPLAQLDLDAMSQQQATVKACHDARKIDLTGVPKDAVGYVVMAKQFGDALLAVTGNDPCKMTNAFDVQIAEVKAKNETFSKGLGVASTLGMMMVGADVLNTAFGVAGGSFTATDSASINTSFDSGNTANAESFNTATSTDESYNTAAGTSMDTVTP